MVRGLGHVPGVCWIFLRLLGLDRLVFVLACTFQRLVELAQETPIPPGGLVGQLGSWRSCFFSLFSCVYLSCVFHVFMFLLVMFLFFLVCSCLFRLFFVSFVGCGHQIAGEGHSTLRYCSEK